MGIDGVIVAPLKYEDGRAICEIDRGAVVDKFGELAIDRRTGGCGLGDKKRVPFTKPKIKCDDAQRGRCEDGPCIYSV